MKLIAAQKADEITNDVSGVRHGVPRTPLGFYGHERLIEEVEREIRAAARFLSVTEVDEEKGAPDEDPADKIIRAVGEAMRDHEEIPTETFAAFCHWCATRVPLSADQVKYQVSRKLGFYVPRSGDGSKGTPDKGRVEEVVRLLHERYREGRKNR